MNELVQVIRNEAVCSSLDIAEHFEKRHADVLESIEKLNSTENAVQSFFFKTTYKDASGKKNTEYSMNRDGFMLLVMGFNGKRALRWKLQYMNAFNEMEKILTQHASIEWKEARLLGKQARRDETDEIKWVVVYYQIYMVGRLLDVRKGYTEDNVEKHWKVYTSEEEAAKDAALFNEDDEIRRSQRP